LKHRETTDSWHRLRRHDDIAPELLDFSDRRVDVGTSLYASQLGGAPIAFASGVKAITPPTGTSPAIHIVYSPSPPGTVIGIVPQPITSL
jgi:hypothetical protein